MSAHVRRVSFGPYVLDGQSRELLRGPELSPVHLSPKAMDTLLLLVAQRPRALSKQQLLERVWLDCVVSEATLASVIAELRKALDESGRRTRYIRTLHGFGYAFSAEVHEVEADALSLMVRFWLIHKGHELPLSVGVHVLGRREPATIVLASPTVSRQHAEIVVTEGGSSPASAPPACCGRLAFRSSPTYRASVRTCRTTTRRAPSSISKRATRSMTTSATPSASPAWVGIG